MHYCSRSVRYPSVYFQIWNKDVLVRDGLVANLGEAQSVFSDHLKFDPDYKLKAYHLVRANIR